jgi:hypothetical protein
MADLTISQEDLDTKIAKAIEAATSKTTKDIAKLTAKNTELVGEVKKARTRVADFEGFDADEVKAALVKAKAGEQKALEDKGEYQKALDLANSQHATEVKDLTGKLDLAQSGEKTLRTRTAIDRAMDDAGVAPPYRKAVRAMHLGDISIIDQEGKPTAMVGDKSVTDHLKAWAETDDGKNFVGDGGQGGGGAGGGTKTSGVENPWAKDTRNLTRQGIMERDNPTQAGQLKREAGVTA